MPSIGGTSIGNAIHAVTTRKISANGRSISAVTVAEVMKSRTVSNERRLAANEPTDAGRSSMRMPSTRSMITAESCRSMRALARSMKYPRSMRSVMSASSTSRTPTANTQSVSIARLGTTRS